MYRSPRRILVTGASGLLGPHLVRALASLGQVTCTSRTGNSPRADLTDPDQVLDLIRTVRPDIIVNCAGNPFPDPCEQDEIGAFRLNRDIPRNIVTGLHRDVLFVQISTDQLYPDICGPHDEESAEPINVYGASKLAGEAEALAHDRTLVLRTNFFGPSLTPNRDSFSDFVRHNIGQGKPLKAFSDLLFSPLHFDTLGYLLIELIRQNVTGVYNAGSREGMTKANFILSAAKAMGLDRSLIEVTDSSGFGFTAKRPKDMRLDVSRLERVLDRSLPVTQEEIELLGREI